MGSLRSCLNHLKDHEYVAEMVKAKALELSGGKNVAKYSKQAVKEIMAEFEADSKSINDQLRTHVEAFAKTKPKKVETKSAPKQTEIPGASAKETFSLANPETEISPKLSEQPQMKTEKLFDSVAEKGVEYNHEVQGSKGNIKPTEAKVSESQGSVSGARGSLYPEIVSEKTGIYKAAKTKITSTDDLASLASANIGKKAQENLISVSTDKNGKILSVYRHTVGLANSAQASPSLIVGQALNNPTATKIWLAHNHPSGGHEFSREDTKMRDVLENLLKGTRINLGDFIAVGDGKYDSWNGTRSTIETETTKKLAVSERIFAQKGDQKSVKSSDDLTAFAKENKVDGIVLLDQKNAPVGVIEGTDFSKIRGDKQEQLLKEIEKRNATGMAVVRLDGNISGDELGNLRRFAAATELNFLDGIDKNGSLQERGLSLNTSDKVFFSDKPQPGNITIDTIKNHPRFQSATVTENKDGSAQVLFRNGDGFKIDFITDAADKGVKLETSYGNFQKDASKKVAGVYLEENKTILFNKDRAGIPTVDHEHIHFLEKSGYLDSRDTRILNMGAKRSGFEMTEEGRADFVAQAFQKRDEQVGIVKQVLQKIGDFFDMVMNAVGHRTTGGVLRDIESGKIMEAKGEKGAGGLAYSMEKGNAPTLKKEEFDIERGARSGMDISSGEAGRGIYGYIKNQAMREYYTKEGENLLKIKAKEGTQIIDLTKETNKLINFIKQSINRTAKEMPGYIKPKITTSNYQRFGNIIEMYIRKNYPSASAYIVNHEGSGIPTGKQVIITKPENFIAEKQTDISFSLQDVGKSIDAIKEKLNKTTDKVEAVKNAKEIIDSAGTWFKERLYSPSLNKEAKDVSEILIEGIGKNFAQIRQFKNKLNNVSKQFRQSTSLAAKLWDRVQESTGVLADKLFNKMPAEQQWDFISRHQKGQGQRTAELNGIDETITKMFKDQHDAENKIGKVGFIKNYYPGMWEKNSARAFNLALKEGQESGIDLYNDKGRAWLKERTQEHIKKGEGIGGDGISSFFQNKQRKAEGSKFFLKEKVFDNIQDGIDLGLIPRGTPLDMAFARLSEGQKYTSIHTALTEMEADKVGKTAVLVKGTQAPLGYVMLPEPYGVKTMKNGETLHYAVKEEVAPVFKNYLSKSLYEDPDVGKLYSAYMGAANHLNQFQLGVGSAFHAGFTTMEAVISHFALGVKAMARGDMGEAVKLMASSPLQVYKNPMFGDKLLRASRGETVSGQEIPMLVKDLELAGARDVMDTRLRTTSTDKMIQDWTKGNKAAAIMRSPLAMVEQMARPILEWLVPRQKFGVFGELALEWHRQNPGATHEDTRSAMQYIWSQIDQRLGQVVYERLLANRTAINVVQAAMRAPGWSGGTILQIGGGVRDFAKVFDDIAHGRKPQMTDKMAYTISLLTITGLINGVMTTLMTGELPKDGKDLLAFRTGKIDEHGNPERFLLPTYAKDIYAYINKPGTTLFNKTHPMISLMADIVKNKDYYGVAVRDKEANLAVQAGQTGLYAAKAFVPFWMRGAQKTYERGDNFASMLSPLVGIMPATAEFAKTNAQKLMSEISQDKTKGTMTKVEFERNKLKNKLETRLRNHDPEAPAEIQQYLKDGKLSRKDVITIQKAVRVPYTVHAFQSLSLKEAMRVYSVATPEEKKTFLPLLRKKSHLLRDLPEEERQDTLTKLRQVISG